MIGGDTLLVVPVGCASATMSLDGKYRYELSRRWSNGPTVTWIMLNPSTADASKDDPTIRRCVNFVQGWGMGGLCVVNLFAWRATDPRELLVGMRDVVGPLNDDFIHDAVVRSRLVVAAWGAHAPRQRAARVIERVEQEIGRDLWCLGHTKSAAPVHPLRQPKDARPIRLTMAEYDGAA